MPVFIAVLFKIAERIKQWKLLSADEFVNKCGIDMQWNVIKCKRE
jgi:hypothetical protein